MNKILQILFYIFVLCGACALSLSPQENWDMIGYIGVTVSMDESDAEIVHRRTYEILEEESGTSKKYGRLTSGTYQETMQSDFKAFNENLRYYKVRVLYTGLIWCFTKLGIPYVHSSMLPSVLAVALMALLIFHFVLSLCGNTFLSAALATLFFTSLQAIELARVSTPDALSSLLLLLLALSYLQRSNKAVLATLMVLLVLTRTDNIIWILLLLTLDLLHQFSFSKAMYNTVMAISLTFLMVFINYQLDNGGWWIVYYNTLVERLSYPISSTPDFTLSNYLIGFARPENLTVVSVLIVIAIYIGSKDLRRLHKTSTRSSVIVVTCMLTFLTRFILFPLIQSRFYFIYIIIFILMILYDNRRLLASYQSHSLIGRDAL